MKKHRIILSMIIMTIISISLIAVSYAIYIVTLDNATSDNVVMTSGTLGLTYTDCGTNYSSDCAIITSTLKPGDSITKTFRVQNTGNVKARYSILFSEIQNTFRHNDLVYKIEDITNGNVEIQSEKPVPYRPSSSTNAIAFSNETINVSETKQYRITIKFQNKETNQLENLNATFSLKMGIKSKPLAADPNDIPANHLKERISDNNIFGNTSIQTSQVATITAVTTNVVPSNAIGSFNVQAPGGTVGSVKAWYTSCESTPESWEETNCYDLYIGQDGGVVAPTNSTRLFSNYSNVVSIDLQNLNTDYVTNMNGILSSMPKLVNLNVSNWDTSNVINMNNMFYRSNGLTVLDLRHFDVSNVTNMNYMFGDYSKSMGLTEIIGIEDFDTSNVTDFGAMFKGCGNIEILDLNNWDILKGNRFEYLFDNCNNLSTLSIDNWNATPAGNLTNLFKNCYKLTSLNLSNWNTSNVIKIEGLFWGDSLLTYINLDGWDLSNVTSADKIAYVFNGCSSLTTLITPSVMSPLNISLSVTLRTQSGQTYSYLTPSTPVSTELRKSWT